MRRLFRVSTIMFLLGGIFLCSAPKTWGSGGIDNESLTTVPNLVGTWNGTSETYCEPGGYWAGPYVLVITEQTGGVFTGYTYDPNNPGYQFDINGALVGDEIRMTNQNEIWTGTLVNDTTMFGTASDLGTDPDFCTFRFLARKQ